eukprot:gb/GECG01000478.1/.p1 GENE.gb/GECG01000478.1/~~gb/GECG01000478.1/.p1  ORF type:complete len:575 (+),score=68.64 gb/GECG01000478.1/:1-1725(+)
MNTEGGKAASAVGNVVESGLIYTEPESTHDTLKIVLKCDTRRSLGIGVGYAAPHSTANRSLQRQYRIVISELHRHRSGTIPKQAEELGARIGDEIVRIHKWDIQPRHTVQDVLTMLRRARKICPTTLVLIVTRTVRRLPYFGELDSATMKLKGVGPVAEMPALISQVSGGAWIRVERRLDKGTVGGASEGNNSQNDEEVDYPHNPVVFSGSQSQLQIALSLLRHAEYIFPDVALRLLNDSQMVSQWAECIHEMENKYEVKVAFSPLPPRTVLRNLNHNIVPSPLQEGFTRGNIRSGSELSLPELNASSSPPSGALGMQSDVPDDQERGFRDLSSLPPSSSLPPPSSVTGLYAIKESMQYADVNSSTTDSGLKSRPLIAPFHRTEGQRPYETEFIGLQQYEEESEDGEKESVDSRSVDTHSVAASERSAVRSIRRRGKKTRSWLNTTGSAVVASTAIGSRKGAQTNDTDSDSVGATEYTSDTAERRFGNFGLNTNLYRDHVRQGSQAVPGTYGMFISAVPFEIMRGCGEHDDNPVEVGQNEGDRQRQAADIHEFVPVAVRYILSSAYSLVDSPKS